MCTVIREDAVQQLRGNANVPASRPVAVYASAEVSHEGEKVMKWASAHNRKCTKDDFRELFTAPADSGTDSLRWLCTTLTGDEVLTDKILSAALQQSLRGSDPVFSA